jgi:hypothetical protein
MKLCYHNHKDGDICCQLLEKKCLRRKTFARCNPKKGSQFWEGVNRVKHKLKFGATMVVNNGENTQFWEDAWAGGVLKLSFPKLYEYSRDKSCE